jgi:iron only hydrogenase large subunit-like protein
LLRSLPTKGGERMNTIQFKEVNCKNCYKCIRSCPVKAISIKNDHAQVIEDGCIFCGRCLQVCPQNAKSVRNDVDKVKGFINKKLKIYASIAPSFAPAFNLYDIKQAYSIFKKLGFTYIEETAVGAATVSSEYQKLLEKGQMKNIITTACPTVVSLIEKHYPELINQLAPVVSPMIAHAKMLKELYGARIKVVFIGPCLSKKEEGKELENESAVDAVITFDELEQWIIDEKLSFDTKEETELKNINFNYNARYYPAPGGIIKSLGNRAKYNYKMMKFDGIDRCIDILDQIKKGSVKDYFVEMNSCTGACLGGACMNSENPGFLELRERLLEYVNKSNIKFNSANNYETKVNLVKTFKDKSKSYIIPEDSIIKDILRKIGKYTNEQELNCGACGYMSCRDKAIAVYNKKAELHMCVPYMRERAESISNVIISSTPNAIFALSEELTIQEVNMAARKLFKLEYEELQNRNIFEILDCIDIVTVNDTKSNILNNKYTYLKYGVVVEQSILYLKENHMLIIVMKDITKEMTQLQKIHKVRSETVDIAQRVIDKQMRVAQEIASLLGETTAETKVALTKLKKSIQAEMGEDI